jgi:23S rRNA-/tRNA-specific pseudouridylate synthase
MRVDHENGKRSRTDFTVSESFRGYTLLECRPLTGRTHQIRMHLKWVKLPIAGDELYGGRPLLLSRLKRNYRLKPNRVERPLMSSFALHASRLQLVHPVTQQTVVIQAAWPREFQVAIKYLRRYAGTGAPAAGDAGPDGEIPDSPDSAEEG